MNDFEKLDQFMRTHKPDIGGVKPARFQPKRSWALPGVAVACAAMLTIFISMKTQQSELDAEALAVAETMEWDFTTDETPAEVADLVALVD